MATFGKIGTVHMMKGWTARDYIRDGLVALWDGIENAGWGTHDSNAAIWKDLVGDMDFTEFGGGKTWEDDALHCHRVWASPMIVEMTDDMYAFLKGKVDEASLTVEYVFTDDGTAFPSGNGTGGIAPVALMGRGNSFMYIRKSAMYANPFGSGYGYYWPYIAKEGIENGGTYSFALNGVLSEYKISTRMAFNGDAHDEDIPRNSSTISGSWSERSSIYSGKDVTLFSNRNGITGSLHSIRIYSRTLLSEEMAFNANVDALRFRFR